MNPPIVEIFHRLKGPNVKLFADANGTPVRVVIDRYTRGQRIYGQELADEHRLEYWFGETDMVIQPIEYDGAVFHEIDGTDTDPD